MKKTFISILLLSILIVIYSFKNNENTNKYTFKIVQSDTKYSDDFCKEALLKANWCGFRYKDKRNLIQFETGLKVELFSAIEIGETNPNCILTNYRDFSKDIWRFTENGKIVHIMPVISK